MHMYLDLMPDMTLLTCGFIVVKSDVGVINSPVFLIFTPPVSLVL